MSQRDSVGIGCIIIIIVVVVLMVLLVIGGVLTWTMTARSEAAHEQALMMEAQAARAEREARRAADLQTSLDSDTNDSTQPVIPAYQVHLEQGERLIHGSDGRWLHVQVGADDQPETLLFGLSGELVDPLADPLIIKLGSDLTLSVPKSSPTQIRIVWNGTVLEWDDTIDKETATSIEERLLAGEENLEQLLMEATGVASIESLGK